MSGFPILDLVVGMIFIFFLLSIICSSAVELLFSLLRTRAKLLEDWLKKIFDSPALKPDGTPAEVTVGQAIMDHCVTTALSGKGRSPSYINSENFVSALLDKITIKKSADANAKTQPPPSSLAEYITAIENSTVLSGELKRTFMMFGYEAKKAAEVMSTIPQVANVTHTITGQLKSELDHFRQRIELWYDKNNERLTGAFKRKRVLPATVVMSFIITTLLNADSIAIGRYLYENREASKLLSEQAMATIGKFSDRVKAIEQADADTATTEVADSAAIKKLNENVAQLRQDISQISDSLAVDLPLGWEGEKVTVENVAKHSIGWLASVLAICLGAPFWFDVLNKIANLRSSGPRPPTDK